MIHVNENVIEYVRVTILKQARILSENAAFNGEMGDGGASSLERKLGYWIDGIRFAQTGKTVVFSAIVEQFDREQDPEYNEYLRLKERFEGK